jgi:hypothetical protein
MLSTIFEPDTTFTNCSSTDNFQLGTGSAAIGNIPTIQGTLKPPLAVCNGIINKIDSVMIPSEFVVAP